MFSSVFLKRLGEECLHAAVAGFAGSLMMGGSLDKAGLIAGLAAAGRAVLGVLAKQFGGDPERPSLSK